MKANVLEYLKNSYVGNAAVLSETEVLDRLALIERHDPQWADRELWTYAQWVQYRAEEIRRPRVESLEQCLVCQQEGCTERWHMEAIADWHAMYATD